MVDISPPLLITGVMITYLLIITVLLADLTFTFLIGSVILLYLSGCFINPLLLKTARYIRVPLYNKQERSDLEQIFWGPIGTTVLLKNILCYLPQYIVHESKFGNILDEWTKS